MPVLRSFNVSCSLRISMEGEQNVNEGKVIPRSHGMSPSSTIFWVHVVPLTRTNDRTLHLNTFSFCVLKHRLRKKNVCKNNRADTPRFSTWAFSFPATPIARQVVPLLGRASAQQLSGESWAKKWCGAGFFHCFIGIVLEPYLTVQRPS